MSRRGTPSRIPRPVPGKPGEVARRGVSDDWLAWKIREQGGLCSVCRVRPATHVDHDHALARLHPHPEASYCRRCIRGILCNSCNSMVGFAQDLPELLEAGAAYVRLWKIARREVRM